MMGEVEVENVVGTITFQQELDLRALANGLSEREEVSNVEYNPEENHWLQTRFEPDDTYVAFYRSGRASVAGARSVEHLHDMADRVNGVMQELLQYEYEPEIAVENIVATTDLGETVSLERLAVAIGLEAVEYEPEQFPGLVYRGSDHVTLVFASGQLLCTGLTELEDVSDALEQMKSRVLTLA